MLNPKIQLEVNNNGVTKEEEKEAESCRMENVNKKNDMEILSSGFKRTKTKHYK